MKTLTQDKKTLFDFLSLSLHTADDVFEKFKTIKGAKFFSSGKPNERFIFIEGTKENRVVLVAHADTVQFTPKQHQVHEENGCYVSKDSQGQRMILGADDRAGCAILWLLKDSGHSLLIVDGEEIGMVGSSYLTREHKDISDKLNNEHQFMIQFDRRNAKDIKTYNVGSKEFDKYIQDKTGYTIPDKFSYTDIVTLCKTLCGANISVGYYNEHTKNEFVNIAEWQNTLDVTRNLLSEELPKFEQDKFAYSEYEDYYNYSSYSSRRTYSRSKWQDEYDEIYSSKNSKVSYRDEYDDFFNDENIKFDSIYTSAKLDELAEMEEYEKDCEDDKDYFYLNDFEYYSKEYIYYKWYEPLLNGIKYSFFISKLKIQDYIKTLRK